MPNGTVSGETGAAAATTVGCSAWLVALASATPNGTVSGVGGVCTPTSAFGRGAAPGSGTERAGSAAMIVSGVSFFGSSASCGSSGVSATAGTSVRCAFSGETMAMPGFDAAAGFIAAFGFGAGVIATSAESSSSSSPPPKKAARKPPDLWVVPPALASSIFGVPLDLRAL